MLFLVETSVSTFFSRDTLRPGVSEASIQSLQF